MKLKEMKKFCNTTPPVQSYRTCQKEQEKLENPYCPATPPPTPITPNKPKRSQRKQKIRTAPPPTLAKCTNILVPIRHSTQRRLTYPDIYVTRLARKFPRAQHTQLRKTEHETLSIHTQITEITMNKGKRKISPVKHSTQQRILNTKTPAKKQIKNTKLPHQQAHRRKSWTGRDQALAQAESRPH